MGTTLTTLPTVTTLLTSVLPTILTTDMTVKTIPNERQWDSILTLHQVAGGMIGELHPLAGGRVFVKLYPGRGHVCLHVGRLGGISGRYWDGSIYRRFRGFEKFCKLLAFH